MNTRVCGSSLLPSVVVRSDLFKSAPRRPTQMEVVGRATPPGRAHTSPPAPLNNFDVICGGVSCCGTLSHLARARCGEPGALRRPGGARSGRKMGFSKKREKRGRLDTGAGIEAGRQFATGLRPVCDQTSLRPFCDQFATSVCDRETGRSQNLAGSFLKKKSRGRKISAPRHYHSKTLSLDRHRKTSGEERSAHAIFSRTHALFL